MPAIETIRVKVMDSLGHENQTSLELKTWTKLDARAKGLMWGGSVFLVGLVMVPIPLIHFMSIPTVFIGVPVVGYSVFKLYSGATDVIGDALCPTCGEKLALGLSGRRWPEHGVCLQCRNSYTVDKL